MTSLEDIITNNLKNFEEFLKEIPDKIVRDDMWLRINSYIQINKKDNIPPNLFNEFFEGRALYPDICGLIEGFNDNRLKLYGGGFGQGHCHEICFDRSKRQYIYSTITVGDRRRNDKFSSSNWNEIQKLVLDYMNFVIS